MTKIENNYGNGISHDSMMNDDAIKRLLDQENKLTADENDKFKKFLAYMEKNYENQFKGQRLNIKDLNLQIQELENKLKCALNG